MKNSNTQNEQLESEMRPGGMLVQRRDDESDHHHHQDVAAASHCPTIEINVARGPAQYNVHVPAESTFGHLKRAIVEKTGLEPQQQKLLFRGKEREDSEHLHTCGVKDKSKILLLEELPNKEEKKPEKIEDSEEMRKALQSVVGIRAEIDKLSERVTALEVAVNSGTKVAAEEFDMSAELLMKELLKLDSIEAEGEARMQRKAEVRRVQKFHETLDSLKTKNSNPFSNSSNPNAVTVTTQWETFDSGVGNLNPPPPKPSSTTINQDWEQFD